MRLTAKNVDEVMMHCLYNSNEVPDGLPPHDAVIVEGLVHKFALHPARVLASKYKIASMLSELPENFSVAKGGGWSFLNAGETKDGVQWGEHKQMEALFCLGMAVGLADYCLPREVWKVMPGGMPYVYVKDRAIQEAINEGDNHDDV